MSSFKGMLFAAGAVGVIAAGSFADRAMNYTETDAEVISAKVDCYVKSGKEELVEKGTKNRAYMDCDMAKYAAKEFGYKESDIHTRTALKFQYRAVADGSNQTGEHTTEGGAYKVGQKIKIYSHNKEPQTTRWN